MHSQLTSTYQLCPKKFLDRVFTRPPSLSLSLSLSLFFSFFFYFFFFFSISFRLPTTPLPPGLVSTLSHSKLPLLLNDNNAITYNTDFTVRPYRLKVPNTRPVETQVEREQTNEVVFKDRQHQVDAAVVRIMKARKSLEHNQLVAEVLQQCRFPLQPQDLKKRIESLIEREYLTRDPDNLSLYKYLA